MANETFSDQLWNGLAEAVADVREKCVEEPMWGRAVSERESTPQWPEAKEPEPSFGSSTHEREARAPEMDMDR